jgi:hypothetical protein
VTAEPVPVPPPAKIVRARWRVATIEILDPGPRVKPEWLRVWERCPAALRTRVEQTAHNSGLSVAEYVRRRIEHVRELRGRGVLP